MDVMGEVDIITSEQIAEQDKAEKEASLVAEGTWEGMVISWNKVAEEEKGENNQFKGTPLYRVGILFYDCPEAGKKKSGFFNMTPVKVLNENGRPRVAYTTMLGLVKALNMVGQPIPDVLEQAKVQRAKYKVAQFTTKEDTTINFLKSVSHVMVAAFALVMLMGCSESTWYAHDMASNKWTRTDCAQSDKGYNLYEKQYHCHTLAVSAGEATIQHR